jgi:hypothetical protein
MMKVNYVNLERQTKNLAIFFAGVAVAVMVNLLTDTAFAQTTPAETTGSIYVALAMSIISLMANVLNGYLAQKAKTVGLNPNSADERAIRYALDLAERFNNAQNQISQLTTFVATKVAPEQWKNIVEGTLPAIKAKELSVAVDGASDKVTEGKQLLDMVESAIQEKKPLPVVNPPPPVTTTEEKIVPPDVT